MKIESKQTIPTNHAFTLIEVLVAAVLAAIILTAIYLSIATNMNLLNTTRQNMRATQIIVSKLEGIKLCAWQTNQLFSITIVPTNFQDTYYPQGLYQNATNQGITYYGTISISTNLSDLQSAFGMTSIPSYSGCVAVVTVTLNWTNGFTSKIAHTRSMSTLVAQNGIQNYVAKY